MVLRCFDWRADISENSLYEKNSSLAPDRTLRGYILTAMFAGVAAAAGYMLMFIPNIEAVTLVLFVAGYKLGIKRGILAAIIAAVLYFGLNPQGGLFPPLLVAQIIGVAAAPILGALFRLLKPLILRLLSLPVMAIIATAWYDLLTNLAYPLSIGLNYKGILITLSAGIPFSLVHNISNVIIFAVFIPPFLLLLNTNRFQIES